MQYVSTRGSAPTLGFEDTMLTGLARDGGLYLPEAVPRFSDHEIAALAGLPYDEVAFRVMWPFIGDSFGEAQYRAILSRAYDGFGHAALAPVKQIGANQFLLELLPSSEPQAGTRGRPRSRRFAALMRWTCSSSFRWGGCQRCSAAR